MTARYLSELEVACELGARTLAEARRLLKLLPPPARELPGIGRVWREDQVSAFMGAREAAASALERERAVALERLAGRGDPATPRGLGGDDAQAPRTS